MSKKQFLQNILEEGRKKTYTPFAHEFLDVENKIREEINFKLKDNNLEILQRDDNAIFPFTSDTGASISPEVITQRVIATELLRLTGFNGYIETEREAISSLFKSENSVSPLVFFAASTTQANKLSLSAVADVQPIKGDIALASTHSHIFAFEVGQPAESVIPKDEITGKLTVEDLERATNEYSKIKRRVKTIHLDQPTKGDYFYSPEEIKQITKWAHERKISVSMDAERLVGYLANSGLTYKDFTSDCGVDIVTVGMQKNGGARSSATIVLNTEYLPNKKDLIRRVESFQHFIGNVTDNPLAIASGWKEMVDSDLYIQNANRANAQATKIAEVISSFVFDGTAVEIQNFPLTTNMIFAKLPRGFVDSFNEIKDGIALSPDRFGITRIVTAHDTKDADVEYMIAKLNAVYNQQPNFNKLTLSGGGIRYRDDKNNPVIKSAIEKISTVVKSACDDNLGEINQSSLKFKSESAQQPIVLEEILDEHSLYHTPYGLDKSSDLAKSSIKKLFGREYDNNVKIVFASSRNQAANSAIMFTANVNTPSVTMVSEDSKMHHLSHNRSIKAISLDGEYKKTGKLNPKIISGLLKFHNTERGMHVPFITSVCIEQPTKSGYVYSKEEISEISRAAHENNIPLIVNMHRFSYHLADSGESYKDYANCGADIVTIGFSTLGGANNSAIVVLDSKYLNTELNEIEIKLNRTVKGNGGKQSGQVYGNIGWHEMIENELWRDVAKGVNVAVGKVEDALKEVGIEVQEGRDKSNIISFKLPSELAKSEHLKKYQFKENEKGTHSLRITSSITDKDIENLKSDFLRAQSEKKAANIRSNRRDHSGNFRN
ncbi:MAG TPA: hypothetical protein DIV86_03765 [Alphaproteobacteria bacterium]|nr:hypothetical protein [Alphaproteobacteria bacterium]